MSTKPKRKHVTLSLVEKEKILKILEDDTKKRTISSIAKESNIGPATVRDIRKKKK